MSALLKLLSLCSLLAACGGGGGSGGGGGTLPPPPPITYSASSGVAQKGPLIRGSAVTAQELDAALSPTGKQYSYQISTDLGNFAPTSTFTSQYIGLSATGYYFDEVLNAVSAGPVTLNGYNDLAADTVVNVNLLTTLAYQRINKLVNSGTSFAAARAQAEREVLVALSIPPGSYGKFATLDLTGSSDGDHILAAISSLFVHGNQAGQLSALISDFQSDLGADGTLTSATTKAALAAAASALNPATVAANLNQRYSSLGVVITAKDIADWIDPDNDGLVGAFDATIVGATPSTVFTFPAAVVSLVAGTPVSATGGQLSVNGTPSTGPVTVSAGDVVTLSPGSGPFPGGVMNAYLSSAGVKVAGVSFVSRLLAIDVTPVTPSVAKGLTRQLAATGVFSDTSTADLTNAVAWTSGTQAITTVTSGGLARGVALGSANITATSGTVSGSTTLTVTAAVPQAISILPSAPRTGVGFSRQLAATATYSDGTVADVTGSVTWTSSGPTVATVSEQGGLVVGVSLGTTSVSAALEPVTTTISLAIVQNEWVPAAALSHARTAHTATLLADGRVLVVGGSSASGSSLASAEIYDPGIDDWAPAASLQISRFYHTATLLPNGKVLVAGGMGHPNNVMPMATTEIYDPAANAWAMGPPMSSTRIYHTATLLANGKVLLVAGTGAPGHGGLPSPLSTADLYDPATNTSSPAATLPSEYIRHSAVLLESGKVLIAGGDTTLQSAVAARGAVYDPATDTWSGVANVLANPRHGQTLTLAPSGRALIVGGSGASGFLTAAESYDPATNTWSPRNSVAARWGHTATPLTDGKLLLAAGYALGSPATTNSVELYDPETDVSTLGPSLSTPRFRHTATLLPNGSILVVGGEEIGLGLAPTELYLR